MTSLRVFFALFLALTGGLAAFVLSAGLLAPYKARALVHVTDSATRGDAANNLHAALRAPDFLDRIVTQNALGNAHAPDYLPLIGYLRARTSDIDRPAEPFAGRRRNAFGGERLKLDVFELSEERQDERFALIVGQPPGFALLDSSGRTLTSGEVGRRVHVASVPLRLRVYELAARPETRFWLWQDDTTTVVRQLDKRLRVRARVESPDLLQIELRGDAIGLLETRLSALIDAHVDDERMRVGRRIARALGRADEMSAAAEHRLYEVRASLAQLRISWPRVVLGEKTGAAISWLASQHVEIESARMRSSLGADIAALLPTAQSAADETVARASEKELLALLPERERALAELQIASETAFGVYLASIDLTQALQLLADSPASGGLRVIEDVRVVPAGLTLPLWLAFFGAALGGLTGVALIWWKSERHMRLASTDVVEAAAGAPVVAVVASDVDLARPASGTIRPDDEDVGIESIRSLAVAIELLQVPRSTPKAVRMTDTGSRSGGVGVAARLAGVAAAAGERVVLLYGDAGNLAPVTGEGCDNKLGKRLTDDNDNMMQTIMDIRPNDAGVRIVFCTGELIDVVIEAALQCSDFLVIANAASTRPGAAIELLVARYGVDTRNALREARERMQKNQLTVDGVVLTDWRLALDQYRVKA